MKQTTTTITTTEVIRRAPKKKTIQSCEHIVQDGKVYLAEEYGAKYPREGLGIKTVGAEEAYSLFEKGLKNEISNDERRDKMNLCNSLLNLSAIRNGLVDMAKHPKINLLDKDDCERLKIIAVQINEFIPILVEIMKNRISDFTKQQFQVF